MDNKKAFCVTNGLVPMLGKEHRGLLDFITGGGSMESKETGDSGNGGLQTSVLVSNLTGK